MQRTYRIKLIFLTLLLVGHVTGVFAQRNFKYRSVLPTVDTSGFYAITLSTELLARCKADMSDIRLAEVNEKTVPYIFGDQLTVKNQASFIVFPRAKDVSTTDSATTFIAENNNRQTINELVVKLRNTSVRRSVNLSGSDDLKKWYAIEENLILATAGAADKNGIYRQILNFPASNYHYFKIQINNERKEPVAILEAGIYRQQLAIPKYTQLQTPVFKQKDSAKISRVFITFDKAYPVNKLRFDISSPKFFRRTVNIYTGKGETLSLLSTSEINSSTGADIALSAKAASIELDIFNEDNPPLAIKSVQAYSLSQSLVSYLEKGRTYHLLLGDSTATTPNYDLQFFTDSLKRNLSQVNTGAIEPNPVYRKILPDKPLPAWIYFITDLPKWALWAAIVVVVLVLLLLTLKMTSEVNNRDTGKNKL